MQMGIGYPKDWVSRRTTLEESPSMSKAVRRYGKDGARLDSTYGSTGGHEAHEDDVPPSAQSHSNTDRVPQGGIVKTVGHRPDGSGKYNLPDYSKTTRAHGSEGHHDPSKSTDGAQGQAWSASGGRFGKQSRVPQRTPQKTTRADAGALSGSPQARTAYQGGKGPIRP
jgi:hypothetical protein